MRAGVVKASREETGMDHGKNTRNLTPLNLTGRRAGDFPRQANLMDIS